MYQPPETPPVVVRLAAIGVQGIMNVRPKMTLPKLLSNSQSTGVVVVRDFRERDPRKKKIEFWDEEELKDLEEIYIAYFYKRYAETLVITYHPKKDEWWKGSDASVAIFRPYFRFKAQKISKTEAERLAAERYSFPYAVQTVTDTAIKAAKVITGKGMKSYYPTSYIRRAAKP